MALEVMVDKAMRLLQAGRVESLDRGRYNVVGDHGTYFVVVRDGKPACCCPGFRSRGNCSHASAVEILLGRRRSRRKTRDRAQ
ncbi:MAG: hypothetical protein PVJ38_04740 [Candidatus Bathyarchaeota archaeon]